MSDDDCRRQNGTTLQCLQKTEQKSAAMYLDSELHRALRLKTAETDCSTSDLVNMVGQHSLSENAEDLVTSSQRGSKPNLVLENVAKDLKSRGKI